MYLPVFVYHLPKIIYTLDVGTQAYCYIRPILGLPQQNSVSHNPLISEWPETRALPKSSSVLENLGILDVFCIRDNGILQLPAPTLHYLWGQLEAQHLTCWKETLGEFLLGVVVAEMTNDLTVVVRTAK